MQRQVSYRGQRSLAMRYIRCGANLWRSVGEFGPDRLVIGALRRRVDPAVSDMLRKLGTNETVIDALVVFVASLGRIDERVAGIGPLSRGMPGIDKGG